MMKYKGIHPGLILSHELEKKQLKKRPFAHSIDILPQILNDITKARRRLTPSISLKIDRALCFEEGTMLLLQAHYDLKMETDKIPVSTPNLTKLRKILFWDTDINKINWQKQSRAVIQRVFERGNDEEKQTIIDFYGQHKVKTITKLNDIKNNQITIMKTLTTK